MVVIKHRGNFNNTEKFLERAKAADIRRILSSYGDQGVRALASATPVDSGLTAGSWGYEVQVGRNSFSLVWTNSNVQKGVPIAVVLQYGHATRNGGFVQGRDYINPAIRPVFDKISEEAWREVTGK
jgi:hypothetical protein